MDKEQTPKHSSPEEHTAKEKTKQHHHVHHVHASHMTWLIVMVSLVLIMSVVNAFALVTFSSTSISQDDVQEMKTKLVSIDNTFKQLIEGVTPPAQDVAETRLDVDDGGNPFLGDANAPVEIIEFGDFQCPPCALFHRLFMPSLKEDFISSGKVKYVFRDFPLKNIHPNAVIAAMSANCAQEQRGIDGYFEMHDYLFENQQRIPARGTEEAAREVMITFAKELDFDVDAFNTCLDDPSIREEVESDFNDAMQLNIPGTPTVLINGKLVRLSSYDNFKAAIEKELEAQ